MTRQVSYFPVAVVKCLARSAWGRGITWTETRVPTVLAASAPASVAAFTAPTSPLMMTATSPSPTCSRPMMVTLAAFTMASAAASAATYPLVSIIPMALFDMTVLLTNGSKLLAHRRGRSFVDRADDQRVDRWGLAGKPCGCDRAGCDNHLLAFAAAERIEGEQLRARFVDRDLQHGPRRDFAELLGGPDAARDGGFQHLASPFDPDLQLACPVAGERRHHGVGRDEQRLLAGVAVDSLLRDDAAERSAGGRPGGGLSDRRGV